jgi:cell division ATPase FtsA
LEQLVKVHKPWLVATGSFDPASVSQFMNPYTEQVIQQSQEDIARLGGKQQQALKDRAVQAGAFGGGRQAIGSAEIGRNVLDQQARTGAGLRAQGFQQAMGQAQTAFENQQRRQQQASQIFGGLGQAQAGLGGQQAALGQASAQLGLGLQGAQQKDVSGLLGLGGLEQAQQQAGLDAYRKTISERARSPYQNIGFLSDIFRGVPSTGGTYTQKQTQDPSMLSQVAGLGLRISWTRTSIS